MKAMILLVIFVVAASGLSEATDPMINYYNENYNDCHAYIALIIGIVFSMLLGL